MVKKVPTSILYAFTIEPNKVRFDEVKSDFIYYQGEIYIWPGVGMLHRFGSSTKGVNGKWKVFKNHIKVHQAVMSLNTEKL